jgi:hypothetical protein
MSRAVRILCTALFYPWYKLSGRKCNSRSFENILNESRWGLGFGLVLNVEWRQHKSYLMQGGVQNPTARCTVPPPTVTRARARTWALRQFQSPNCGMLNWAIHSIIPPNPCHFTRAWELRRTHASMPPSQRSHEMELYAVLEGVI